ncbi:MAG: ribosome-associated translation inhibitor RaiA [Phycisphaerales bacterium]|nr:ribosome-associated translation inhibitor RaiA [Phycisphaerales bacterium]
MPQARQTGSRMRIEVVGRNVTITDAIRDYCAQRADKLPRYFDGVQMMTFRISSPDHDHHREFDVELVIDVAGHDDFVSHAKERDLYAAIDLVAQKGQRQLVEHKDRLREHDRGRGQ